METKSRQVKLPTITEKSQKCSFDGYDAVSLMVETAKLRRLITKRGTLEILIPLCCTTDPVRYIKFKQTLHGISSKTLAIRLKELQKGFRQYLYSSHDWIKSTINAVLSSKP